MRLVKGQRVEAKRRRRDIFVVGVSHAGQHAYTAGLGIAIPYVVSAFHSNYAVVGVLLSFAAIAANALQLLALFVKRSSARLLFTLQNLGSTVGAVIAAVAPSVYLVMLGRFVQSGSGWPQHPVGAAYLSNRYPKKRGTILSWHVTAGNLGTLLAPLIVPVVVSGFGWRGAFWFLSAVLALTTVLVATWLPSPWKKLPLETAPSGEKSVHFWEEFKALLSRKGVIALLVSGIIASGGQGIGVVGVFTPAFLHDSLHETTFSMSFVMTTLYVGAVVGPILLGSTADRMGHRRVLLANYALGAVSLVTFVLLGRSLLTLAVSGLLVGIFTYSELSLRQTLFSDLLSDPNARAGFGIFFTVSQSIGSIWIAILGIAVTDVGFVPAFLLMASTFVVAGLVVAVGTKSNLGGCALE